VCVCGVWEELYVIWGSVCGANHVKSPVHKTTSKYLREHRWCFYTSSGFTEVLILG